jgi:hypothetical protein
VIVYARVARFEGIDSSRIDAQVAAMKEQMTSARAGEVPEGAPEEVGTLMETITRFVQLVDRDKGTAIGIAFSQSEGDIRRADEALNAMSPAEGEGRRSGSAEIFEVVIDESFG